MRDIFVIDNLGWIVPIGIVVSMIIGAIQRYREKKIYGYCPVEREFLGTAGKVAGATLFRDLPPDITGAAPSGTSYEPDFGFDEEDEAKYEEEYEQNAIFKLVICDNELSYEGYDEEFFIGVFLTRKKALDVAAYYLNNVKGFKDYECAYRIDVIDVIGEGMFNRVYQVTGWDINEYNDEINIIESGFYIDRKDAVTESIELKRMFDRDEWVLESYAIDELKWSEGFVRG